MKLIYHIVIFCLLFSFTLSQENNAYHKDAIFSGVGLGTNFGGYYGFGYELSHSKYYKAHMAIGSIYGEGSDAELMDSFGFDIGIKYFFIRNAFIGVNYGMIDFHSNIGNPQRSEYEIINGLSFIFGLKFNLFDDNGYISAFGGYTDDKKVNTPTKLVDPPFPKMGIQLGIYLD